MNKKPCLDHINASNDLITSYEEIRAGFVSLALEKNRQATPYVEQARALKVRAQHASSPNDLLNLSDIQEALLATAGVSNKAAGHMMPEDKVEAVKGLIETFLIPAGEKFVEELVFRFLLTKGDALGGTMRNIGGALAQSKLNRSIISSLTLRGIKYAWLHGPSNKWIETSGTEADIERQIRGISWANNGNKRTIVYNLSIPLVKNNVDLSLLDCNHANLTQKVKDPGSYILLGELKGGIDPAGADEHWKTANTALIRIRTAFTNRNHTPFTFFLAAAIAKKMANEIWDQLERGELSNAANLTNPQQVASLAQWICNL
jgi:hypothetical protein